ncbi:MAG: hypothetical protein DRJ03_30785 [Chloroflexi bacterium]|nr:MAG: hypothetical protein DRI81_18840 [Chloroflexota bacterium]RLC75106.1 MAG: hypothetical protein DRJ03_30785 [Chloroflexota bacterium]
MDSGSQGQYILVEIKVGAVERLVESFFLAGVWQIWFYSLIGRGFTQINREKSAEIYVNLRSGSENHNLPVST